MSAPEPAACGAPSLLVVIDPAARRADGESVRIARDVLGAGASTKVCLPENAEEFAHALHRRGARQPVVIGDDRALLRAVSVLHRDRTLANCAFSLVPVGGRGLDLARALGVPTGTVAAARAVLDGVAMPRDLLVDDSDGVVLAELLVPAPSARAEREPGHANPVAWLRSCQSLVRTLAARPGAEAAAGAPGGAGEAGGTGAPGQASGFGHGHHAYGEGHGHGHPHGHDGGPHRLRVEADGELLADLDRPVDSVRISPSASGAAEVEIEFAKGARASAGSGAGPAAGNPGGPTGADARLVRVRARAVTISGPDFHYRADDRTAGPVRRRTWTVRQAAWSLVLP